MLIKHSMGALATDKAFLTAKSRRLRVRSARRPTAKVAVASERPMMVRYWRCHPYESLLCAGGRDEDPICLRRTMWGTYIRLGWRTR